MNKSTLLSPLDTEKKEETSFNSDILKQGEIGIVGTIIRPVLNKKEGNTNSFPSCLYVVTTKAGIWLAFSLMYKETVKCPFSESFWQSLVVRSPKVEEMKNVFKFHLICDLRSKESSLIPKPGGRPNNNTWKGIVRLQKLGYEQKSDEKICQWGRDLAYFIDELLSDGRYYTPYRFAANLTPPEEQPLSYYLTITEIFNILKIRYPFLSNKTVLNMLKEKNLVSNYFDDTSFKQAINYVNNDLNIPLHQTMNSHSTSGHNDDGHTVSNHIRKLMTNL